MRRSRAVTEVSLARLDTCWTGDLDGKVTLRYQSQLRHLGSGRRLAGTRVLLLVADRDVQVINDNGELLATFTIDPTKQYQTQQRPGQPA